MNLCARHSSSSCNFTYVIIFINILLNYCLVMCKTHNSPGSKAFVRSFYTLTELARQEMSIYAILMHYSFSSGTADENTKSYLEDYENSSGQLIYLDEVKYVTTIAGHPFLSFRMINRYILLSQILYGMTIPGIIGILNDVNDSIGWPKSDHVEDALDSIIRVQHVYDLDIPEFASGIILGSETGFGVRARECYMIGNFAMTKRYFAAAVNWLHHAKTLVTDKSDSTVEFAKVEEALSEAVRVHDLEWEEKPKYDPYFFTDKLNIAQNFINRRTRRNYQATIWRNERGRNFNEINFWRLCFGEDLRTPEEKSQLLCWYETKSNPAFIINPLKIERLAWSPDAVQIYDVLSGSIIEKILHQAQPRLEKSELYTRSANDEDKLWNRRTSATAWLQENKTSVTGLDYLPRLIELITGLVITLPEASEPLHIATYTFGGHYDVHHDVIEDDSINWMSPTGDRIATFMLYLSDVEKGGYTAFPQGGIAARPIKGSAVFWYNMKRSGLTDRNSYHGACPVILGRKWIFTKWIRHHRQYLTRPCSIDQNE